MKIKQHDERLQRAAQRRAEEEAKKLEALLKKQKEKDKKHEQLMEMKTRTTKVPPPFMPLISIHVLFSLFRRLKIQRNESLLKTAR
jgi:hypothetical protein